MIGGGAVVGSGCALDAASRGLNAALAEARDLASGTYIATETIARRR